MPAKTEKQRRFFGAERGLRAETTQYDAPLDFYTAPEAEHARQTLKAISPKTYEAQAHPLDASGYVDLYKKATESPAFKNASPKAKRKFRRQAEADFVQYKGTI